MSLVLGEGRNQAVGEGEQGEAGGHERRGCMCAGNVAQESRAHEETAVADAAHGGRPWWLGELECSVVGGVRVSDRSGCAHRAWCHVVL